MPPYSTTKFSTDTATLVVFDPACLAHRARDDADWWSIPEDELDEVNRGNALFVSLGSDGIYTCDVFRNGDDVQLHQVMTAVTGHVRCESGCLYIGAGEQVPGGGFGPEAAFGGALLYCAVGTCEVTIALAESRHLLVWLSPTDSAARNHFDCPMALA